MTTEDKSDNTTNIEIPAWYIDDGLPGPGIRPNWLPEKYKSVADMAKSNAELERRLGTAPDKYDFAKSKYLDPNYAPFQDLQSFAKEKRVSQEVMDKVIESVDKFMDEFSTNTTDELRALGDNAKERVQVLDNWAKANLSKDSYDALTNSINSAGSIKALEELRGKFMSSTPQVPGNNGTVASTPSLDDIKIE